MFQKVEWRPTAGRKTSNALMPIVEDEAVNAEDHTTICGEEEPAYRRSKAEYAHKERERGTKNISIHKNAIVTSNNNNSNNLLEVTKSLYIVTHLGQLPFMLFT